MMRYLLLSVLVVCVVGVMIIPIAYATHSTEHLDDMCSNDRCPFPAGVIYPAYQFENDTVWKINELYKHIGYPKKDYAYFFNWDPYAYNSTKSHAKIISGDGEDLLVFNLLIKNKQNVSAPIHLGEVIMYDNKDRKFTPSTSYTLKFGNKVKNDTFSWHENCPDYQLITIQPGKEELIKVCYKIPKNSDHFKVVSTGYIALVFDKAKIENEILRVLEESDTTPTHSLQTAPSNFDIQKKLDEYWNCGNLIYALGWNIIAPDCLNAELHYIEWQPASLNLSKDQEMTYISVYDVSCDPVCDLSLDKHYDVDKKLKKFQNENLHKQLFDIYVSITPKQLLEHVSVFDVSTDDWGDIQALVRQLGPKFAVNIDPVDTVFKDQKYPMLFVVDEQYLKATLIHENAHILSLNVNQRGQGWFDNKGLPDEAYDSAYKFKQHMTEGEKGCDNYYNDWIGCLDKNSYLNAFFQKFWAEIYHDYKWSYEFDDSEKFTSHNNDFYNKYQKHSVNNPFVPQKRWITNYSAESPDEDFAESFTAFVLKEENTQGGDIVMQKMLFFYEYPELVEMRNFIRSAIATSEFCDNGEVWKDGKCQKKSFTAQLGVKDSDENVLGEASGCLIATAAFGSEMAPQVQFLRELRDNTVLQTESGTSFMTGFNQFYYSFSPYVADYERENPAFKETVKLALTPLLTSLTLLQYVDIDSESEMLGYGIGVILLNIGMYFVAPAVLLSVCIRKISKN